VFSVRGERKKEGEQVRGVRKTLEACRRVKDKVQIRDAEVFKELEDSCRRRTMKLPAKLRASYRSRATARAFYSGKVKRVVVWTAQPTKSLQVHNVVFHIPKPPSS
jgi:hypothetical protein